MISEKESIYHIPEHKILFNVEINHNFRWCWLEILLIYYVVMYNNVTKYLSHKQFICLFIVPFSSNILSVTYSVCLLCALSNLMQII